MIEKWKKAVDSNKVFGAVLTDLSKALAIITSICHDLLKAKLNAYRLSLPALKLIKDYLKNRTGFVQPQSFQFPRLYLKNYTYLPDFFGESHIFFPDCTLK